MADPSRLQACLEDGDLRIEPLAERHREPLRAACAEDREIWDIYPHSMLGEHFDPSFAARLALPYASLAILLDGRPVGLTAYIRPDGVNATVEIGGTYVVPSLRGGGLNGRVKRLMIEHAFALGFRRVQFMVDERNARSQAAVLKLGARREGTLRQDRVTWTGYVRNTVVFGLLREEWQ